MKILSLFDGISCGRLALERAGIPVEKYYASEIDKYAIQVAQKNYPDTIQVGDVNKLNYLELLDVDMIIGGSPCQDLSIAKQNRQGLRGERSGLFWKYVEALEVIRPKWFLLENVASMRNEDRDAITETLKRIYPETECIMINSALLSAQQRKRYYWTNWHVEQPQDKGILLKDILESGQSWKEKSPCIDACYYKGGNFTSPQKQSGQRNMVAEPAVLRYERTETAKKLRKDYESHKIHHGFNEFRVLRPRPDNKSNTLSTVLKDNMVAEPIPCAMRTREDELGKFKRVETKDDGKANCISTVAKDSMICMPVPEATKKGYTEIEQGDCVDLTQMSSKTRRGRSMKDKSNCLTAGECQFYQYLEPVTRRSLNNLRTPDEKANCLLSTSWKGAQANGMTNIPERVGQIGKGGQGDRIYSVRGKSVCLNANGGGGGAKTGLYKVDLPDGDYIIRKLTPVECARLQTMPDHWCDGISATQQYKCLGNGWTVDVIAWIFSQLPKD